MQRSYIFLADGFEEVEALATVDIMRRAGMDVATVSISDSRSVAGAHSITVEADHLFDECDFDDAEWLIAPGGMPGAANLGQYEPLCDLLRRHRAKIAAICAAPAVVLAPLGILAGKEATCYPGFENACVAAGAVMTGRRVVALPQLITANGPSSAVLFALAIVANSLGDQVAREVGEDLLVYSKSEPYYF